MRVRLALALVCVLALAAAPAESAAGGSPASDQAAAAKKKKKKGSKKCKKGYVKRGKKCKKKKKPPVPDIVSGGYSSGYNPQLSVDTATMTVQFDFYLPCRNPPPNNGLNGTSGPNPVTAALPGKKVGTKLSMSGSYTAPSSLYPPQTTTWQLTGKFTQKNVYVGTLHFVADVPAGQQTAPAHCEDTVVDITFRG